MKLKPIRRKKTMAALARRMVVEGKTDTQIYAALRRQFNLPEDKRWYVRWFRAEVARKLFQAEVARKLTAI